MHDARRPPFDIKRCGVAVGIALVTFLAFFPALQNSGQPALPRAGLAAACLDVYKVSQAWQLYPRDVDDVWR